MKLTVTKLTTGVLSLALLALLFLSGCKPKDPKDPAHVKISMTDAPGAYDAVYVDVQAVEITGAGGTVTLNTTAGIYNLLDLANGTDTLIAEGDLAAGKVEQIRLILGSNNSVVVNGTTYPLSTPSAQQSGLKLQVHQTFEPGVEYAILLDFDANQSIVTQGNGGYSLKPVIRTVDVALGGSIRGSVTPIGALVIAQAITGTDTFSSVTNANGEFLIGGLAAGTYSVVLTPPTPLIPVTISNVQVTAGANTNVGLTTF